MPDQPEELGELWYHEKSALMGDLLGVEHDRVMHAIIPFAIGGGLDLYYYTGLVPGTAIATKELSEDPASAPSNREFSSYELAMFTRAPLDLERASDESTPFGKAHARLNAVLNGIAAYALDATLNPGETCEFPGGMGDLSKRCVIFDALGKRPDGRGGWFGILTVIEIFRSEMKFAMKRGSPELLDRLRHANHYPYSDLDRKPVA